MKIGLFGGSFNPVHRHHVKIAETVRDACGLDEVWFIPVHQPVHKGCDELLPYEARRSLLETVIRGRPGLRICDVEREMGGPSFTIRTVRRLREKYSDCDYMLVIGADSLRDLPGWMSSEELVREVGFAVVVRPGISDNLTLPNETSRWVPLEPDSASSTSIRAAIGRGRLKQLPLAPSVTAQIVDCGYYGCWAGSYKIWNTILRARVAGLPAGLRTHIESVARLAAEYACEFGLDARLGLLAGLAHDLFRGAAMPEIFEWIERAGIRLSSIEKRIPMLSHGAAASAFLGTLDPPPPPSLRRAVRWHTFPKPSHAPLTRALIMADALDPSRADPERDRIRDARLPIECRWRSVVALKRRCAERAGTGRCRAEGERPDEQPVSLIAMGCPGSRE